MDFLLKNKIDKESLQDYQKFFMNVNDDEIDHVLSCPNEEQDEEYTARNLREKKSIIDYDCYSSAEKNSKQ